MAQPSDLKARAAASEARVGELAGEARAAREDAAAAQHLAAANHRGVAEARRDIRDFRQVTAASFYAMRSDLTDLQTEMRTGFTQVRGQLDGAAAGIEHVTSLSNTLIAQQGDQPNGLALGELPGAEQGELDSAGDVPDGRLAGLLRVALAWTPGRW